MSSRVSCEIRSRKVCTWPRDVRRRRHEGMRISLTPGRGCAAVVGRVGGVERGDPFERHRLEVFRLGAHFSGQVQQNLFRPGAHGVGGQGICRRRGVHMERPCDPIGRRFDPTFQAGFAAEVDAAMALGIQRVGDDHVVSLESRYCRRQRPMRKR